MKKNMGIFNTVKFKILEIFILGLGYKEYSQEGSHIKYKFGTKSLIIPKHKEISRGTINNIFKIISIHTGKEKKEIEISFIEYYTKIK